MRYWVYGRDAASSAPRDPLFVEADSEEAARAQARELGVEVAEVERVEPRVPAGASPAAALAWRRPALLAGLGLLLLAAGAAAGWAVARRAADSVPATGRDGGPGFEEVGEAGEALRMAGLERALVYRWSGAVLDGSVLLDTSRGPERVALDTEGPSRRAHANQQAAERLERPTAGDAPFDPSRVRGLVVIAVRPKAAGVAGHECVGVVRVRSEGRDGRTSGTVTEALFTGRVPDPGFAGAGGGASSREGAFHKLALPGGEERELLTLRLRGPE